MRNFTSGCDKDTLDYMVRKYEFDMDGFRTQRESLGICLNFCSKIFDARDLVSRIAFTFLHCTLEQHFVRRK